MHVLPCIYTIYNLAKIEINGVNNEDYDECSGEVFHAWRYIPVVKYVRYKQVIYIMIIVCVG